MEVADATGTVLKGTGRNPANLPSRPQVQMLLSLFATSPDMVQPIERILKLLWGPDEDAPGRNSSGVEKAVFEVREIIQRAGDDRNKVVHTADGYMLRPADSIEIDYATFLQRVQAAKGMSEPAEVTNALDTALAMWRGHPPAALQKTEAGRAIWSTLWESRAVAELLRIDQQLATGRDGAVLDSLAALVSEFSDDERFMLRRISALSRNGQGLQAVREYELFADRADDRGVTLGEELMAAYRNAKGVGARPAPVRVDDATVLSNFLGRVVRASGHLRFGDATVAHGEGPGSGSMTLDRVWTPLNVALSPADSERLDSRTEEVEVITALEMPEHRHVVLLGRPGGGKSTVVSYRTHTLAVAAIQASGTGIIPIHVRLPSILANADAPSIDDIWPGVHEVHAGDDLDTALVHILRRRIGDGEAALLFDGLDEVQEERLKGVLAVIRLCCDSLPNVQIVVTCRTFDYTVDTPRRKLPLPTIQLLPFEPEQELEYIDLWYRALSQLDFDPTLMARRANLQRTLLDTPTLMEMGQTPLLLALMTLVHTQDGELPAARAILYRRTISHLLAETASWRERSGGSTIASQEMLLLAARVGFEYHRAQEVAVDEFRGLTERRLTEICEEYFQLYSTPIGSRAREAKERIVRDHLLRLVQGNGLLLEQGGGTYDFAFKQYREFLAGLHIGTDLQQEFALTLATRPHWHECFQLLASHEAGISTNISQLLLFIEDLADSARTDPPFHPADAVLAAEMLSEIGRDRIVMLNQGRVLTPSTRESGLTGLWMRVGDMILPLLDLADGPGQSLRLRAGFALGQLGDPRITASDGTPTPLTGRLVSMDAARVAVGTPVFPGSVRRKLESVGASPRDVELAEFAIARFPVTNIEFRAFVDDGGYRHSRWWQTDEAAAWRDGDPAFIERLEKLWVDTAEENYAKELQEGYYTLERLEATAADLCRARDEPYFFGNRRFNGPNQPVVGVNFWEARAYCAWLTDRGRSEGWLSPSSLVRLPSEWEWEYASTGGAQTVYPWGDEWAPALAHTRNDGTPYNQATPVGCYPQGTWPGGPSDMAGNVWEWTSSRLSGYGPEHDIGRDDPVGLSERAIRGSSWYDRDAVNNTKRTARYLDLPGNIYFDLGFRVAVG